MLESGEETFFPALYVGSEKTSAVVSFLNLFMRTCKMEGCEAFNSTARKLFYIASFKG